MGDLWPRARTPGSRARTPGSRLHDESGVTTTEYVAVLVVMVMVVGAVAMAGLRGSMSSVIVYGLDCIVAQQSSCDGPGDNGPDDGPDDAPTGDDDTPPDDGPDGEPEDGPNGPPPPVDRVVTDGTGDDERAEGDEATGNPELDELYDQLGRYHTYLWDTFGRDSWDDEGGPLNGEINASVDNAQWNGSTMSYAPGWVDEDITVHEVTHGMIQDEAGLVYQDQSGALNEAIADMMASNVTGDWEIGENSPRGTLRDMSDPESQGQPAHTDDYLDTRRDHGGVHTNSGIPNHAYYLMVEANGREASEQALYLALTEHLESDATFEDFRTAMLDSTEELYGQGDEWDAVNEAFADVGLDGTWSP